MKMRDLLDKLKQIEEEPSSEIEFRQKVPNSELPDDALDLADPDDMADTPTNFSQSTQLTANNAGDAVKTAHSWTGKSGNQYSANTEYDQAGRPVSMAYTKAPRPPV